MNLVKTLVVIPCYNEEANIRSLMPRIVHSVYKLQAQLRMMIDILVVNDGSTDHSAKELKRFSNNLGYYLLHHRKNQGYGEAMKSGFRYAIKKNYDWVISFDLDKQHDPNFLDPLVRSMLTASPSISMISGSRYLSEDLMWQEPWKDNFLVNCIISSLLFHLRINVSDAFCGFKAIRVSTFKQIQIVESGYGMPLEFWIKFHQRGLRFIEIPVPLIFETSAKKTIRADKDTIIQSGKERIKYYFEIIRKYAQRFPETNPTKFQYLFEQSYLHFPEIKPDIINLIWNRLFLHVINMDKKKVSAFPQIQ